MIYYDQNKLDNFDLMLDSLVPREFELDNAEIDDDNNVFPVE